MKKFGTMILVALVALAMVMTTGCGTVKVNKTQFVGSGKAETFAAATPGGVMMNVTVNPKDVKFENAKAEAQAKLKLPDWDSLPSVQGWFLINMEPTD